MAAEVTGHGIQLTFSQDATLELKCKATTDPGFVAGDKNDQSHNDLTTAKEFAPNDLFEVPDVTLMAVYDMADRAKASAIMLEEGTLTFLHNKSGSQVAITGWLAGFEPQEATTGNQPEVQVTLQFKGGDTTPTGTVSSIP